MQTAPEIFAPIFALAEEAPSLDPAAAPVAPERRPGPSQAAEAPTAPGPGDPSDAQSDAQSNDGATPPGHLRLRVPKVYIMQTATPARLGRPLS